MAQWEDFELGFLYPWALAGGTTFTSHDVANTLNVTTGKASEMVQAYLSAVPKPNCATDFAIHRTGRTRNAVWHVGHTVNDLRKMTNQFADDVEHRVVAAITPMIDHIADLNPKARPQATKTAVKIGRLIQSLADLAK
jgi:hypothetical protein